MTKTDWDRAAAEWIAVQGAHGDFSREHVLDPVIVPLLRQGGFQKALDVGCGEGRFCRVMQAEGIETIGLDPTAAFLDAARRQDPDGAYVRGVAEALPFQDAQFDLVVSYVALVDIPDFRTAISEMVRVLAPGGTLLVANLTGFRTAKMDQGWVYGPDGEKLHFPVDDYLQERAQKVDWLGTKVENWHRPLSAYMRAFLGHDLRLTYFDNPPAVGGTPGAVESYTRAPWLVLMAWEKDS